MTNKFTLNKMFNLFIFYLKLAGIRINMEPINDQSLSIPIFNYFNLVVVTALLIHFVYSIILYCIDKDLQKIFFIIPCITYSSLSVFKFYLISLNKNFIEVFFRQFAKYNTEENTEVERVCQKFERPQLLFLKMIINVIFIINGLTLIAFSLTPLLLMALEYMKRNSFELLFIFPLTYPLNHENNIFNYLMIYSYQTYAGIC